MVTFLFIAGLVLVVLTSVATRLRLRNPRYGLSSPWNGLLVGLGIALALPSFFVSYAPNPTTRVVGFPIPAAVWELSNGLWLDFVGPFTLVAFVLNAVELALLPQLIAVIVIHVRASPRT